MTCGDVGIWSRNHTFSGQLHVSYLYLGAWPCRMETAVTVLHYQSKHFDSHANTFLESAEVKIVQAPVWSRK
jgi:hypothetical protein